jgi:hypothetical protein
MRGYRMQQFSKLSLFSLFCCFHRSFFFTKHRTIINTGFFIAHFGFFSSYPHKSSLIAGGEPQSQIGAASKDRSWAGLCPMDTAGRLVAARQLSAAPRIAAAHRVSWRRRGRRVRRNDSRSAAAVSGTRRCWRARTTTSLLR